MLILLSVSVGLGISGSRYQYFLSWIGLKRVLTRVEARGLGIKGLEIMQTNHTVA